MKSIPNATRIDPKQSLPVNSYSSSFTSPGETFVEELKLNARKSQTGVGQNATHGKMAAAGLAYNLYTIPLEAKETMAIQAKLTVNTAGDKYEQEADAMADKIMRMPAHNHIQRKCAECEKEEEEKKPIQRKSLSNNVTSKQTANETGVTTSPLLDQKIASSQESGHGMDQNTRSFMSNRFGIDFGDIRIHSDQEAAQMNQQLNAKAFTIGNDIYFNTGEYKPGSETGKHLLAHELTHVIQQNYSNVPAIQRAEHGGATGKPSDWKEQVAKATTSAEKAALIKLALGPTVDVFDATAKSSADKTPNPSNLKSFTAASPIINFDNDLQSKTAKAGGRKLTNNSGYTLFHNKTNFVILSAAVIEPDDYYEIIKTVNHEFDHVRQNIAGSKLVGNASELDAWTSSFIREFHRSYTISESNGNCRIINAPSNLPILKYYGEETDSKEKQRAVQRISDYYKAVLVNHPGHLNAFRLWILRTIRKTAPDPALAQELNKALSLNIAASASIKAFGNFTCDVSKLSFDTLSVSSPTFPSSSPAGPAPSKP